MAMREEMTRERAEEILGLSGTYGRRDLRHAYTQRAMEWHPDVAPKAGHTEAEAHERMVIINKAMDLLAKQFKDDPDAKVTCVASEAASSRASSSASGASSATASSSASSGGGAKAKGASSSASSASYSKPGGGPTRTEAWNAAVAAGMAAVEGVEYDRSDVYSMYDRYHAAAKRAVDEFLRTHPVEAAAIGVTDAIADLIAIEVTGDILERRRRENSPTPEAHANAAHYDDAREAEFRARYSEAIRRYSKLTNSTWYDILFVKKAASHVAVTAILLLSILVSTSYMRSLLTMFVPLVIIADLFTDICSGAFRDIGEIVAIAIAQAGMTKGEGGKA